MPSPQNNRSTQSAGVINHLKQAKEIWAILTSIVSAGSIIRAFLKSVGGPVQFLMEVGMYGFACYVSVWVILPIVIMILAGLEKVTGRDTTDVAAGIVAGVSVLGGGALIRWGVFHPRITEDVDTIGTAFMALSGVAVLAVPFIVLWYFYGSKSRAT
jgi:hypothetical protein